MLGCYLALGVTGTDENKRSVLPIISRCDQKRSAFKEAHFKANQRTSREIDLETIHKMISRSKDNLGALPQQLSMLQTWRLRKSQLGEAAEEFHNNKVTGYIPEYLRTKMQKFSLGRLKASSIVANSDYYYLATDSTILVFKKQDDNSALYYKDLKVFPLNRNKVIDKLSLDKNGNLIVFVKSESRALKFSQEVIDSQLAKEDINPKDILKSPYGLCAEFKTTKISSPADIKNLSDRLGYKDTLKFKMPEFANQSHYPDSMAHYYSQGYDQICGLSAWFNVLEQIDPNRTLGQDELKKLFTNRFEEREFQRAFFFDRLGSMPSLEEANLFVSTFDLDLQHSNLRKIAFTGKGSTLQKLGISTFIPSAAKQLKNKTLAENASHIKSSIDSGKIIYASVDSEKIYQDSQYQGGNHALALVGYSFDKKGRMKILTIDSNYGYLWYGLEHFSTSVNPCNSWTVSKKARD